MSRLRRARRGSKHARISPRIAVSLADIAEEAAWLRAGTRQSRALLAGMSGIDGSGKTELSKRLARELEHAGLRTALICIDPWQNPQTVRFGGPDPGLHFYDHAIRFDELFAELVDPLVKTRSIHLTVRGIRTDRDVWDDLLYDFDHVDVVLLEGILIFQQRFVKRYDLRIWVECSFETAGRRAVARNVEDLPAERLIEDYDRIYHVAQRHHLLIDDPKAHADIVLINDGPTAADEGTLERLSLSLKRKSAGCLQGLLSRR